MAHMDEMAHMLAMMVPATVAIWHVLEIDEVTCVPAMEAV